MQLANFAIKPEFSKGRMYGEPSISPDMNFQIDRGRIIHSQAFRRLEYKTQVFINHLGDHYRTRLTHTLEVAQITRIIARKLNINEDLAEIIALSHDLGHPPFGHAGEDALAEAASKYGGFDHNVQTIKIMTMLEHGYPNFEGLNLTWEVLEGTMKHNGPLTNEVPDIFARLSKIMSIDLHSPSSLEAQVAGASDDIAYCNHDIDDGIRANMFHLDELLEIPLIADIMNNVKNNIKTTDQTVLRSEFIRKLTDFMINNLTEQTQINIKDNAINSDIDVRAVKTQLACFTPEVEEMKKSLKSFLMNRVYKHYKVNRMTMKSQEILKNLFNRLFTNPECLPTEWFKKAKDVEDFTKAAIIKDYISGMTDRYAISEYNRLFNPEYF